MLNRFPPVQHRLAAGLPLLVLSLWSCESRPVPSDPGEVSKDIQRVILISIDTTRADHLSCYGYPRATTPNIDRLAARGVLFEDCYSPTSWTLPSHLSMHTGLAISAHGIDDDRLWSLAGPDGEPAAPPLNGSFLAEHFSDAGYITCGYYSWQYLEPHYGFGAGFGRYQRIGATVYSDQALRARLIQLKEAGDNAAIDAWEQKHPEQFLFQQSNDERVVSAGLEFLDEVADERCFLFLHLFDPHEDYLPPAPFDQRFTDPDYRGPIDGSGVSRPGSPVRPDMRPEDLEQLIALYDGEIAWTDAQIGRLLDGLEQRGWLENTLICLTADHGEEFFEHGHSSHRNRLYRESTHVPLILAGVPAWPRGERISGTVGLVDVLPTLLACADLGAPEKLSGRDLGPIGRGEVPNTPTAYSQVLRTFRPDGRADLRVGLREDPYVWL